MDQNSQLPYQYDLPLSTNNWMQTYSGITILPELPRQELIYIEDIAHHLALQCRFNGACREFYSVAQHSVMVASIMPKELCLEGLMHDAAEAYTGDVIRPMKITLNSATLRKVEYRLNQTIAKRFGLVNDFVNMKEVRIADLLMLKSEAHQLMRTQGYAWDIFSEVDELDLIHIDSCWSWQKAEEQFLGTFYALKIGR